MSAINKLLLILILTFSFYVSDGQETPFNPLSFWVFTPYIYNPAMVGSKDFLSVDINAAFHGKSNTQIISENTRFSKTKSGYFTSPDIIEFKNTGIGGSVFTGVNGSSRDIGVSAAGSYQIPINTRNLSFLSFGASFKGVYNLLDTGSSGSGNSLKKTFYPNLDLGVYYYGTNFFTGFSATNVLRNPEIPDSLGLFGIPLSRQYFFTAGYKILLSKSLNIVLEPSVLINASDSILDVEEISENINPVLKLYVENFCIGTYFLSDGNVPFFFQYRFPRIYIGAFFELPKKSPYFKRTPVVEFTLGINLQIDKSRLSGNNHW